MNIRSLTPALAVTEQITAANVAAIADAGYRTIVCNRPDGESEDQTAYIEIEQAAVARGLQVYCLPVISGQVQDDQAVQMAQVLKALPEPVLAYCRTGTRSVVLWALAEAGKREVDEILHIAERAGYDLSVMRGRLEALANDPSSLPAASDRLVVCPGVSVEPLAAELEATAV